MSVVNCSCNGINENCNKCDGKGYYDDKEETIDKLIFAKGIQDYSSHPGVAQLNYGRIRFNAPKFQHKLQKKKGKENSKMPIPPRAGSSIKVIKRKDIVGKTEVPESTLGSAVKKALTLSLKPMTITNTISEKYIEYSHKGEFLFTINDHELKDEFCRFWIFRLGRSDLTSKIFLQSFTLYKNLNTKERTEYFDTCLKSKNSMDYQKQANIQP